MKKEKYINSSFACSYCYISQGALQLDVVADKSISSFESVINELPIEADSEDSSWILTAPDNSAKFLWSKDFSSTTDYDVKFEFDSQPFINAGLDISKLPKGAGLWR